MNTKKNKEVRKIDSVFQIVNGIQFTFDRPAVIAQFLSNLAAHIDCLSKII